MISQLLPHPEQDLTDDQLLGLYAYPGGGPWVRFNVVSTLDGASSSGGVSAPLGNDGDRRLFALLRRHADVVLVGAGTVRAEGYAGDLLDPAGRNWRLASGAAAHPALAVISGSLDLDPAGPLFTRSPVRPLILTGAGAPSHRHAALEEVADVVVCGDQDAGGQDVEAGLCVEALARRGLRRILCEGGPRVLGAFAAGDAVDELCLSLSPLLTGGGGQQVASGPVGVLREMRLASLLCAESALYGRWVRPR